VTLDLCCNVLQFVAVPCRMQCDGATIIGVVSGSEPTPVMQYVAVCCNVLQCVAVCCSVLQCVAVCCIVLQCVTVCCNVLQCYGDTIIGVINGSDPRPVLQCVAVCCSVLQCVAVYCNML